MAGSCEISNIFSNYISAMYQPDEVQPTLDMLGHLGDDNSLGLSPPNSQPLAQSTDKPEWFSELPYFWTKVQVLEWISYHVEKNKYDASSIDFSCCNMDGHALCHCTRDQMRLIFGPLGDELYDRLHEITSDELNWIIDLLEKENATSQETFLDSSHLELGNPCAKDSLEDMKPTNPFLSTEFTCLPGAMSPGSSDVSGPVMSHSPNSQDSGGSDLDLDPTEAKLFPDGGFEGSKKGDNKHGKRKRGRPRKLSKESRDCLESRKSKHCTPERYPPVGVHQGHPNPPRAERGADEVGGPAGGRLQVPALGGGGSALGPEEEEQQHDLREAEPSHEILLQTRDPGESRWAAAGVQVWEELQRLEGGGGAQQEQGAVGVLDEPGSDKPLGDSPKLSSLTGNFACSCIPKLLPCAACETPSLARARSCVLVTVSTEVFKDNILSPVGCLNR